MTIASYGLLSRMGYKAEVAKIGSPLPTSSDNKLLYPDVLITRNNHDVDYERLHEKCLLTINGFIQNTVYDDGKVYIQDGAKQLIISRNTQVGIISFYNHSREIRKLPITTNMIYGQSNTDYYEKVYINYGDEGAVGNFIFVLAGYMLIEEEAYIYRTAPDQIALHPKRLQLKRKILELSKYTDIFAQLGLPNDSRGTILNEDDITDDVIEKLLTLPNTFLMNFTGGAIGVEKKYLEHSNIPGLLRTEHDVILPLRGGDGKFLEYAKKKSAGDKFNISIADPYYSNYVYSQLSNSTINTINDARDPNYKQMLTPAYFLEIEVL